MNSSYNLTESGPDASARSVFAQAARVFDGWNDPETGLRVLQLSARDPEGNLAQWYTLYHQFRCFLDGGRYVLLHNAWQGGRRYLLDLTTGDVTYPVPPEYVDKEVKEVMDPTWIAVVSERSDRGNRSRPTGIVLWDIKAGRELASFERPGWLVCEPAGLSDGRRALQAVHQGQPYDELVRSEIWLIDPDAEPRLVLEAEGFSCNHIQTCPTDPELYAYDRWPCPKRPTEQVIHLARLDGSYHEPVPLTKDALRPAIMFGARDHYVWTPDGKRIVSYLCPHPFEYPDPSFDAYALEWWLSATDWRTGEDLAAEYPPGRWGGHFQISPDSKYIVSGGAQSFQKLYVIDIAKLREGWNERVLCGYPPTQYQGKNDNRPFHLPFVLPDQSGVIFNAGWPDHTGAFLVEWPEDLR